MSLTSARDLAQTLDGRVPGHLITSQDWNAVASILVEYGNALIGLPDAVDALQLRLDALTLRVDALEALAARVQQLEDQTAPLREQYRLTVSTTSETVLVGQVATLVFRATALDGSPLPSPMPWLDIVTTWGRLRPVAGFNVRANAEENALAVQFNSAGEARVQLSAQFTRGFTAETEAGFTAALAQQAGSSGMTVQQALMAASSPLDGQAQTAFQAMAARYDASSVTRNYADGYVDQMTAGRFAGGSLGGLLQVGQWQNYRATVMAFAKPDSSAATPDPTRAVATIQVNFREWISHWSDGYVKDVVKVSPRWKTLLDREIRRDDALPFFVGELAKRARSEGTLGHVRNLVALDEALAQVQPGDDAGLAQTRELLSGAVQMQFAAGGSDTKAASSYATQAQAGQQATKTARSAQASAKDAASAKQAVLLLEDRVKSAEAAGKDIVASLRTIGDGVNKINVAEVADLGSRLSTINVSLNQLASRIPGGG